MALEQNTPKQIIVPIHGVRRGADGNWQQRLQLEVAKRDPSLLVVPFYYNRIPAVKGFGLAFLQKIGLKRIFEGDIRNFALFLQKIRNTYPGVPVNVLGHSNGTWITICALKMYQIKVHNIVMVQPVFSRKIHKTPIRDLYTAGLFKRMFVWSSKNDKVVGKLVRILSFGGRLPGYGMAGYSGMIRPGHKEDQQHPPLQPIKGLPVYNTVTSEPHGGVLGEMKYLSVLLSQLTGPENKKS